MIVSVERVIRPYGYGQQAGRRKNGEIVMSKFCAYLIFALLSLLLRVASLFSASRQLYYLLTALLMNQSHVYEQAPFLADFMGNV